MTAASYIIMFGLGLILLVWGSNLFVDSAILLANRFHVSEVLIGATIVSFGTTLPETLFSTMASAQGFSDMALGNALGSILCNTGFIAGTMLLLKPLFLERQAIGSIASGICFLAAGFVVYAFGGMTSGGLTELSGIILLTVCGIYILSQIYHAKEPERVPEEGRPQDMTAGALTFSEIIRIPVEVAAIYTGAGLLVDNGPKLAAILGIPEMIISLTFVALGTSLPELVTSLAALKKHHSSISLGNIIGADILNFVLVGGLSSVIHPIHFPPDVMRLELPVILYMLFVLCVPSIIFKKAGRWQGILLLGGYGAYLWLML